MKKFLFFIFFLPILIFAESPNIVLISIDTLQIKRTSLYGYKENTTPHLKNLSKKGMNFENSYTPTPLTLPAHSTLLTGIFPHNLGVYDNLNSHLSEEFKTIPEILKEKGYKTIGIVSSYILSSTFGISQGFDYFEEISFEELKGGSLIIPERDAKKTTDIAIKYLKNIKEPFFLFIHYFDPHIPYNPPEIFKKKFKDPYDGEVAFVDFEIERLFKEYPEIKNSWVFIVSDHGEGLGENDELTHGYFLYKTTTQVLTLIIPPEKEKIKFNKDRLTSLADIFPTILKITNIDLKEKIDGIDLFKEEKERFLPLETFYAFFHHNFSPLRGITDGKFDYILNFNEYDRKYQKIIKEIFKNSKQPFKFYQKKEIDENISSLGYLTGPLKEIPPMEKWKIFPSVFEKKDFINKISMVFERGNLLENLKELEKIAPEDPEVLKMLGDFSKKNKEFNKSINYYEKALKYSPFYFEIYLNLAQNYLNIKKFKIALMNIEKYLRIIPNDPVGLFYKASILDELGNEDEAIKIYKKSIENGFLNQDIILKLSILYIKTKNEIEAEKLINDYLKKEKSAPLLYFLGNIYKEKDKEKAIQYYTESMNLMPNFLPPYLEISDLLDIKKGKEILKKAIEMDPEYDKLWEKLGDIYFKENNISEALKCYNKALKYTKEKERLENKIKEINIE